MSNRDIKINNFVPFEVALLTDLRMLRVKKEYPNGSGFGIVVMTLLILKTKPNFMFPLRDIDLLADEIGTSFTILDSIIRNSGFFKIIESQEELFLSPYLNYLLKPYQKTIENRSKAGKISAMKRKIESLEQEVELKEQLQNAQKKLSELDSSERANFVSLSGIDSNQHKITEHKIKEQKNKKSFLKEKSKSSNGSKIIKTTEDEIWVEEAGELQKLPRYVMRKGGVK